MFNVYWGDEYLDGILDTLSKHNVKTTFFVGGSWADDNMDYLKKFIFIFVIVFRFIMKYDDPFWMTSPLAVQTS